MSYQHKSGSTKRKEKQRREDQAKRGRKTLFEFGWTSKPSNAADSIELHAQDDVQSGNVIPLPSGPSSWTSPGSDAIESNTGLEHNIEEASTSSKEGTQEAHQEEIETYSEIGTDTVTPNSEETLDESESETPLLNVDELLMTENISQSEVRAAVLIGPGSSMARQTGHSYPNDEYGKAFPISIFVRRQSNGEMGGRDWLRWNCKGDTLHCYACRLFSKLPDHSKSSLSKPESCNKKTAW